MEFIRSEFTYVTLRGVLCGFICRMLLPFVMARYHEFWGLREAALHAKGKCSRFFLSHCYYLYCKRNCAFIPLSVKMDGPPCLPHGITGIHMGSLTHLGTNVTILQHVTIGQDTFATEDVNARRFIGNNVFIGAGATIIGGVTIGDNCRVGANCCVYKDLPANSVAIMAPTRVISKPELSTPNSNSMREGNAIWIDGQWHHQEGARS